LFPDQQDRGHKSTQSYVVVRALVILVYPGLSVHDFNLLLRSELLRFRCSDCGGCNVPWNPNLNPWVQVDGPSTNKVVGNDQNLDVEGVNDKIHFYDSVDWLVRDEEIDASGNSDDQRTPIPPMPWIHVNSCKLNPQVSDATAKITSSDDHRIKRKRRQYRPKVKNIRHATPIPPAPPLPRAPSLAQAPAPVQGKKSIFQIMFKNPRKATHIPFVTTTVPPPPPPPPSWSLFSNCFTSSESSCLPPPLPPLNMPEMKDKYYGDFVRLGSYNSNTSSSPDLQPMGQPPTFIKEWMNMTDEAMDASGNSDDQRTPTPPPVPWIHVNYNKPNPQISVRHARAPALAAPAHAPAPTPASTPPPASIFRSMFKKQNKDKRTHLDTAAPTPPPPPRSFLNNIFKPGNKNKKLSSSKTSPLPPLPPTRSRPQPRPPPQPKPQPQHYYRQSSVSSSSQSSYIPQPPPLPPFDMPANKYKYIGQYFVRLRSFNSNTSSSPDLQPMGQPSTSTDSGDMLWSSPDVNAKAGIFI
ncbi:hypothetical protein Tco_1421007, partial [Tanacetum coccineum]